MQSFKKGKWVIKGSVISPSLLFSRFLFEVSPIRRLLNLVQNGLYLSNVNFMYKSVKSSIEYTALYGSCCGEHVRALADGFWPMFLSCRAWRRCRWSVALKCSRESLNAVLQAVVNRSLWLVLCSNYRVECAALFVFFSISLMSIESQSHDIMSRWGQTVWGGGVTKI